MSQLNRGGVYILMFDIPNKEKEEKRRYSKFIKHIKDIGYVMMQESVYYREVNNLRLKTDEVRNIKNDSPIGSNIQLIVFTLKEYKSIISISGNVPKLSTEKVIVI